MGAKFYLVYCSIRKLYWDLTPDERGKPRLQQALLQRLTMVYSWLVYELALDDHLGSR